MGVGFGLEDCLALVLVGACSFLVVLAAPPVVVVAIACSRSSSGEGGLGSRSCLWAPSPLLPSLFMAASNDSRGSCESASLCWSCEI